jgi:ethanolamine utilization protein EutN
MQIAKVIGNVWATRKDESLQGFKFLVIKEIYNDNKITVAVDGGVGAGIEDLVLVVGGSSARVSLNMDKNIPVDSTIVGVVDSVDVDKKLV